MTYLFSAPTVLEQKNRNQKGVVSPLGFVLLIGLFILAVAIFYYSDQADRRQYALVRESAVETTQQQEKTLTKEGKSAIDNFITDILENIPPP